MDLNEVRNETAELLREHGLENDEESLDYVTDELIEASEDASDETDVDEEGEEQVGDEPAVRYFTVNGHTLLYCPAGSRTYICYTPECTSGPRRRLRTSAVYRIEHIGYCGVPRRKYKMFVRS